MAVRVLIRLVTCWQSKVDLIWSLQLLVINILKNTMPGLSQTAEKGGRRGERTGQLDSCGQLFLPLLLFLHLGLLQHSRLFKNVKLSAIATALGCNEVAAVPSDVRVMLRQSEVAAVPSDVRVMLRQSEVAAVPSDVRAMLRQSEVAAFLDGFTAIPNGNFATEVLGESGVTASLSRSDVTAIINQCDVTGSLSRSDVKAVPSDVTAVPSDVTAIPSDVTAVPSDVTTSAVLLLLQVSPGGLQRAAEAVWRGPLQVLEAGQPGEVGGVLSQL
jgi:hypothetical protein